MIFTFYSYKGGVGRSMTLANIAELFYQEGLKVLMVDWDLEAPGLERYFPIKQDDALNNRGLLDLILSYKDLMSQELKEEDPLNLEDPEKILIDIYPKGKGKLQLLTAGQRLGDKFSSYSQSVVSFDWKDFYENWEGERYFEWLRSRFEAIADIVLIDSRTGVTEIGGVCTYQMADTVLMFCAPNYQNLHGIHEMATRLMSPKVGDLRGGRPLKVIVIPARVERSDSKLLDDFKLQFLESFKEIVFPSGLSAQSLWELGISYVPKYALAELVAIREEREANLASAEKLALEIRKLGAMLVYVKEGDQSILDDICKKIGIQPEHISFDKFGRLTELVFSSPMMTVLPPEIGQFTQLKILTLGNIEGNSLKTLPPEIGQLSELNKLSILGTKISVLPSEIAHLTNLTSLALNNNNNLKKLPECIGQLTNLTSLDLGQNNLRELPEWIGQLANLTSLDLGQNNFSELPEWLSRLTNLTSLDLGQNNLKELPMWLVQLTSLTSLNLSGTNLMGLPKWLSQLINIASLNLSNTNLMEIPEWLTQLKHLEVLYLDNNPLNPALQSAYNACKYEKNYKPLWAYLRSLEQNAEPLYEAKLVLVGEGNVGKTTLFKALKGKTGEEAPKQGETTTHGLEIDIHGLRLLHPDKNGVEIQLNVWEFGGAGVYRVTHQFFFSRRSLYLLAWEPRRGVQQCQVEDWLNMIRLRVGEAARVIIISTYSKSGGHTARIDKAVFMQQYGEMIVGFYEVDSLVPDESSGEMTGIAELKQVIAREAAKLEQMGMLFNNDWKAARDELLQRTEPRITYSVFREVCAAHGLSQIDSDTLARLMHDLGYIVHYSEDENLCDDVVLKPQWLTKAIGFVLEDRATAENEGILPDAHLTRVWRDHSFKDEPRYEPALYPFFLHIMEKYDVLYRLPEERHASLVAQHVPQVRPALPWLPEDNPPANLRRIAMICALEEDPPGLLPWMIVRTHDYAVKPHPLHWQKGMFLSHGTHGQAMLEKRGREFHVYVQADWPEYFMNVLYLTLEKLITDNWPGLKDRYRFMVPCTETIDGQPCKGRFPIQALRQWLTEGDSTTRCPECTKRQSIAELLLGFGERTVDVQLREINEKLDEQESRIANYFMSTMRAIADEAKSGPRLFTLHSRQAGLSPQQLFSRPLEIRLWCEAEGCQHPVIETQADKGVYPLDKPREWLTHIAPYANAALKVLAIVTPIAAPAINSFFGPDTTKTWNIADQLDLANAILDQLPDEIKASERGPASGNLFSEAERSGMLALHRFLAEADPDQKKLGLHRVPTYTGDYRWLCDRHYAAWQPKIPDVIEETKT